MTTHDVDILRDTLDLLLLKALSCGPMHGWGIARRLGELSRGALRIHQGSLYPALQRLWQRGWVTAEWRPSENNRRAKYYALTPAGERQLAKESEGWKRLTRAVNLVLVAR